MVVNELHYVISLFPQLPDKALYLSTQSSKLHAILRLYSSFHHHTLFFYSMVTWN